VTRARAPGKVVLSGAYAVLQGAPALVSAVSRYVVVDTERGADRVTPEVQAALGAGRAPWFDASALRDAERKLGLGSSAAILVASLYALECTARPEASDAALRSDVLRRALVAHRAAQGGGSGVDVAASTYGGTLCYRIERPDDDAPTIQPIELPQGLCIEVWTCPESASTRDLIRAVSDLGARDARQQRRLLSAQAAASERAATAARAGDGVALLAALRDQHRALHELGCAAGVPIVTPELAELAQAAEQQSGVLLPAGAGGGDIALFIGLAGSTPALRAALEARRHHLLPVELSVAGVALA
jgi:phosphomevalonate kinase